MTLALSSVIAFGGRSWWTQEGDDKGFVYGSNTHFIKASRTKLKHDRSNTGLNAFSSFPIFPFQHIHLVSVLSRLCNGKLLQKHFSVSRGSRGHRWCHSQSNQWQIGPDMCSPMREWDWTAPLAFRLISHRTEYVRLGGHFSCLFERLIPAAALRHK